MTTLIKQTLKFGFLIFIFFFSSVAFSANYLGPTSILYADFDDIGPTTSDFKDIRVNCPNGFIGAINSSKDGSTFGGAHSCNNSESFWLQRNMAANGHNGDEQIMDGHYCIYTNGGDSTVCTHGEFDVMNGLLTSPPPLCLENCFSNVLFLPGIKGSVLKSGLDTIWPPTIFSFNDVAQLALDEDGESINDIHVDGILNEFITTDIYEPFSNFMEGLVDDGTINEWLPLAYDWRFSPEKIIEEGIKTETEVLDVINEIESLAQNSKTGKVVIVAHSMGGLFGKAIIKKLEELGKDNLIDSFVMVGTPQLGTPQAISSILHGDGEGISALGFITIANRIDIRRIAQNMPSAYNLLPSPKYFTKVFDPVIQFDEDAPFTQAWQNLWDDTVTNYSEFEDFMTGGGVRISPLDTELKDPEVLDEEFMADSANFHNFYDNYELPSHVRVVQVAGWGMPTVKSVEYKMRHGVAGYDTKFTREGDKTVVYKSAVSSLVDETYYFNIFDYNKNLNSNAQHRDILGTTSIQNLLKLLIKKENILDISFVFNIKPTPINAEDLLAVSTHSPVLLGAYDGSGNFTGIDSNQDLSLDILNITENIPGSTFLYTADSQYIFLPREGTYDFIYKGIGSGPTTVEIENFSADVSTPVVSYIDMPTTSNTKATFTVQSTTPEQTKITLDLDGDEDVDAVFNPTPTGGATRYPFHGFLQPINDTTYQTDQQPSVFKAGSTIPVKFQLKRADGPSVQTNTLPVWLTPKIISSMNATVGESIYTLPATIGTNFKWDPTSQQYIYNWNTKGFQSGKWYQISVKLDDGATYNTIIGLR